MCATQKKMCSKMSKLFFFFFHTMKVKTGKAVFTIQYHLGKRSLDILLDNSLFIFS